MGAKHVIELKATVEAKNISMISTLNAVNTLATLPVPAPVPANISATNTAHVTNTSLSSVSVRFLATMIRFQSILKKN